MIRSPECVDALEARIASNVEYVTWRKGYGGLSCHKVLSKSFAYPGYGYTAETAVSDFLRNNHLGE